MRYTTKTIITLDLTPWADYPYEGKIWLSHQRGNEIAEVLENVSSARGKGQLQDLAVYAFPPRAEFTLLPTYDVEKLVARIEKLLKRRFGGRVA